MLPFSSGTSFPSDAGPSTGGQPQVPIRGSLMQVVPAQTSGSLSAQYLIRSTSQSKNRATLQGLVDFTPQEGNALRLLRQLKIKQVPPNEESSLWPGVQVGSELRKSNASVRQFKAIPAHLRRVSRSWSPQHPNASPAESAELRKKKPRLDSSRLCEHS